MIVQCQRCHLRHDLTGRPPGTRVACRCGAPLPVAPHGGETVALTCPQCGGQADSGLARCRHCDSALATVRCPSCFALAFDGAVHCRQCGGSLDSPAVVTHDNGREPLPCPRCRNDLDAMVAGEDTLIDACPECGGIWLDHVAFESLLRDRRFPEVTAALNIPGYATGQSHYRAGEREALYVPCPLCEQLMHRRNYAKRSGIILDVCASHGIWFDADELAQALSYRIVDEATPSMRYPLESAASPGPDSRPDKSPASVILRRKDDRWLSWGDGLELFADLLSRIVR